jgi:hypothetical protein
VSAGEDRRPLDYKGGLQIQHAHDCPIFWMGDVVVRSRYQGIHSYHVIYLHPKKCIFSKLHISNIHISKFPKFHISNMRTVSQKCIIPKVRNFQLAD